MKPSSLSPKPPPSPIKRKIKPKKVTSEPSKVAEPEVTAVKRPVTAKKPKSAKKAKKEIPPAADVNTKYPILQNEELIQRFLKVPMSNNQKGMLILIIMLNFAVPVVTFEKKKVMV